VKFVAAPDGILFSLVMSSRIDLVFPFKFHPEFQGRISLGPSANVFPMEVIFPF
jgi:hypothetical protein